MRELLRAPCRRLEDRAGLANAVAAEAARLGFSPRAQAELAICVAELVANVVRHAGAGELLVLEDENAIEVVAVDHGPGIADVPAAMLVGAKRGLGAVGRLMTTVRVECTPGGGTTVVARRGR